MPTTTRFNGVTVSAHADFRGVERDVNVKAVVRQLTDPKGVVVELAHLNGSNRYGERVVLRTTQNGGIVRRLVVGLDNIRFGGAGRYATLTTLYWQD